MKKRIGIIFVLLIALSYSTIFAEKGDVPLAFWDYHQRIMQDFFHDTQEKQGDHQEYLFTIIKQTNERSIEEIANYNQHYLLQLEEVKESLMQHDWKKTEKQLGQKVEEDLEANMEEFLSDLLSEY